MKTNEETTALLNSNTKLKDICRSLAGKDISAIVMQKETTAPQPGEDIQHWSGQPGQDLFFNGWKLLF